MNSGTYATASELVENLRTGQTSSRDLLEQFVRRYEQMNKAYGAIIRHDLTAARARADGLDQRQKQGQIDGPLHGLPITIKDTFDVFGMPAASGSASLVKRDSKAPDAVLVSRLVDAGAVIWGKTNTPFMAGDVQTYNKPFGITSNPYNSKRTSGGSSGGAAVALALGLTPLELGSDLGGSLRNPAHFCGVCSLKPSYGKLPMTGHVPPHPKHSSEPVDLAVAGPLARNVEDLELAMAVLSGGEIQRQERSVDLSDYSIGIWDEEPGYFLDQTGNIALSKIADLAKSAGAQVTFSGTGIDGLDLIDVYVKLLAPILLSEAPKLVKLVLSGLYPILNLSQKQRGFSLADTMASAMPSKTGLMPAQQKRAKMKQICSAFFARHDVLIAPVTPTAAPIHNTKGLLYHRKIDLDGETIPYTSQLQWIALATVCHLPVVTIPVTQTSDGLPVGVQVIAAEGEDSKALHVARLLERQLPGFIAPPDA